MKAIYLSLALLLCTAYTANAAVASVSTSFTVAPVQVLTTADISTGNYPNYMLLPSGSNTSFALFGFKATGNVYATTYRTYSSVNLQQIGSDSTITPTFTCVSFPKIAYSPSGMTTLACSETRTSNNQVFLHTFATTSPSTMTELQVTSNTDATITYTVCYTWYQGNYTYVAYTSHPTDATQNDLYVQGVSIADGKTTKFTTPLKINAAVTKTPSPFLTCGQYGAYNETFCLWRRDESSTVVGVTIDLNNKNVTSETLLFTDNTTVYYTPLAVVTGSNYYAALVGISDPTSSTTKVTYTKIVAKLSYVSTVINMTYTLNKAQYVLNGVAAYQAGWALLSTQYASGSSSSYAAMNLYQRDGSVNGTQYVLATDGTATQLFVNTNGTAFVLYTDANTLAGTPTAAYVGQVFSNVNLATYSFGKALVPSLVLVVLGLVEFVMF